MPVPCNPHPQLTLDSMSAPRDPKPNPASPALSLWPCQVGADLWHSTCTDFYYAALLLTLGVGLGGLAFSGYWINFGDISPRFDPSLGHPLACSPETHACAPSWVPWP